MAEAGRKIPISSNPAEVEAFFKNKVGLGISYDIGVRKIRVLDAEIQLYYVNGLTETISIIQIMKELLKLNNGKFSSGKVHELVENYIVHMQVEKVKTYDEMVDKVLSGLIAIYVEGKQEAFIIDVRNYPGRTPMEPDTEKVVRGARDGYVENIVLNTALTRRRIRDERLRFEMMKVGERSKTDVSIAYIEGVADPDVIETVRKELKAIDIDGITMADKTVEEFILKQNYNPFPLIRYTERADVAYPFAGGACACIGGYLPKRDDYADNGFPPYAARRRIPPGCSSRHVYPLGKVFRDCRFSFSPAPLVFSGGGTVAFAGPTGLYRLE